ncbi:MAG: hypothetical protein RQ824_06670 [bacterium]|nr:hypothetical protein [bacterium]
MECNSFEEITTPLHHPFGGAVSISFPKLKEQVSALADLLEGLNSKTEAEFLAIGSSLNSFYARVADISKNASSSADLILGKEISRAIGDFKDLQGRVDSYLGRIEGEMGQCMSKLREILKMIISINKPARDLKDMAQMLQMLAVSTRIVTVNLSRRDAGFSALSDNIKNMSKLINLKSSDILKQTKSLGHLVNNAISTLRKLEDRQSVLAGEIFNNTSLGLSAITNMKNRSNDAAGITNLISERSDEISANISKIMVSLQFHDITRQKIDQTVTIMNSSIDESLHEKPEDTEDKNQITDVLRSCLPLKSDLDLVKNELLKAVNSIIANMGGIARHITNLSSEIGDAAGAVSEDYSDFWLEMDQVMSSFTTSIREDADTSGKLSEVMGSVAGTVSNMSHYASDIEEIGSDVKLIAFNARIKAAHVGSEGASVGLLAEKIQKLSVDATLKTASILSTLTTITSYANELSAYENSATKIEDVGLDDVVSRLIDILNPLHMVDDKIISYLNSMDKDSDNLARDINFLIAGVTVHDQASNILEGVINDLKEIQSRAGDLCPDLESYKSSDTVQGKDEIPGEAAGVDEGDENGNIELF